MRIVDTSIGFQSVFIDGQFNLDGGRSHDL